MQKFSLGKKKKSSKKYSILLVTKIGLIIEYIFSFHKIYLKIFI